MVDLNELINMPGYGKANAVLKDAGYWRETMDDTERIEWLEDKHVEVKCDITDDVLIATTVGLFWGGGIRGIIDEAAVQYSMRGKHE